MFPAVYMPLDEIVPPVAVQVTPLFEVPVTVAENPSVLPAATDADVGLMLMVIAGAAAVTITVAFADFELSAMLVAVTLNVPAVLPAV